MLTDINLVTVTYPIYHEKTAILQKEKIHSNEKYILFSDICIRNKEWLVVNAPLVDHH